MEQAVLNRVEFDFKATEGLRMPVSSWVFTVVSRQYGSPRKLCVGEDIPLQNSGMPWKVLPGLERMGAQTRTSIYGAFFSLSSLFLLLCEYLLSWTREELKKASKLLFPPVL